MRRTDTLDYVATRFAEKMGKPIRKIDKSTLEMCETYQWPGNIRELQNIVERSMILCSGDTFRVDDGWLSIQEAPRLELSGRLAEILHHQEKKIIEAALTESKGKVSGPYGAVRLPERGTR